MFVDHKARFLEEIIAELPEYECLKAATKDAAAFNLSSFEVDLMVLNIDLLHDAGFMLLAWSRHNYENMPIILVSEHSHSDIHDLSLFRPEEIEELHHVMEAVPMLIKPFHAVELLKAIEQVFSC